MTNAHGPVGYITLIPSAVNFTILVSFLYFKLRKPISVYFSNLSESTKKLHDDAKSKYKEAELLYQNFEQKMASLDSSKNQIEEENKKYYLTFINEGERKSQHRLAKLDEEVDQRLVADRLQLIKELSSNLLDSMVQDVKNNLTKNDSTRIKVDHNLMKDFSL